MAVIEQKTRTKSLRLCAHFQAIIKMKKKKRQTIFTVCRLVSEWGDSNARPLRPERSALPTALHSVTIDVANIVHLYKTEKFLKFFIKIFARVKNLSYLCTRKQDGAIAQLVEQRTENPCVPGSIPGGTTWKSESYRNVTLFFCLHFRPFLALKLNRELNRNHKQGELFPALFIL